MLDFFLGAGLVVACAAVAYIVAALRGRSAAVRDETERAAANLPPAPDGTKRGLWAEVSRLYEKIGRLEKELHDAREELFEAKLERHRAKNLTNGLFIHASVLELRLAAMRESQGIERPEDEPTVAQLVKNLEAAQDEYDRVKRATRDAAARAAMQESGK